MSVYLYLSFRVEKKSFTSQIAATIAAVTAVAVFIVVIITLAQILAILFRHSWADVWQFIYSTQSVFTYTSFCIIRGTDWRWERL